jgi:hypothetical protein
VTAVATKLIRLTDGTLVEAEVTESEARPISGGVADRVASAMERIGPVIVDVCRPVAEPWATIFAPRKGADR